MHRPTLPQTIRNHAVLICLVISTVLFVIAAHVYPGGSLHDKNSAGFVWSENFISNLFGAQALNGLDNPARGWALVAIALHALGYGLFFIGMAGKLAFRHAATVLKVVGVATIFCDFLIATPLHDLMIMLSSTLTLLGLFYITVFILKTRLHLFKVLCIAGMLTFYYTLFLYGSGDWGLLAIMQKVSLVGSMLLVLALEYFTGRDDFSPDFAVRQE